VVKKKKTNKPSDDAGNNTVVSTANSNLFGERLLLLSVLPAVDEVARGASFHSVRFKVVRAHDVRTNLRLVLIHSPVRRQIQTRCRCHLANTNTVFRFTLSFDPESYD